MNKLIYKLGLALIFLMNIFSCSTDNSTPIIKFSEDNSSINITNIDKKSFSQVKNMVFNDLDTANFISVIQLADELDTSSKEEILEGNLKISGDTLIFKPKTSFVKGKTYLVENYINLQFANVEKILNGSVNGKLKPQVQTLKY